MTTHDPQALYAACQRLERATGRKIVPEWMEVFGDGTYFRIGETTDDIYHVRNDEAAADILEARLWRAVREWCDDNDWHLRVFPKDRVSIRNTAIDLCLPTNLISAANEISEFVEKQKEKANG